MKKTKQILNRTDCAVLVADCTIPLGECEKQLISIFKEKNIPFVIAKNKADLLSDIKKEEGAVYVSAKEHTGIEELKNAIAKLTETDTMTMRLVGDLIKPNDMVVLCYAYRQCRTKGQTYPPSAASHKRCP